MGKFLTGPIGSALRVFVGALLGGFVLFLENGGSLSDIDLGVVEAVATAAVIVATPILIAALNPADTRFGRV